MNNLKFRAWNTWHGGRMYLPHPGCDILIRIDGKKYVQIDIEENTGLTPISDEEIIVMLFTGKFDNSGNEVYELDIVDQGDNYPSVIEWCKSDEMIEGTGFCLHEYYPRKGKYSDRYDRYHTLTSYTNGLGKVIGNVFENPFMLPKSNQFNLNEYIK